MRYICLCNFNMYVYITCVCSISLIYRTYLTERESPLRWCVSRYAHNMIWVAWVKVPNRARVTLKVMRCICLYTFNVYVYITCVCSISLSSISNIPNRARVALTVMRDICLYTFNMYVYITCTCNTSSIHTAYLTERERYSVVYVFYMSYLCLYNLYTYVHHMCVQYLITL
jgi:hypothetical protein